MNPNNGGCKVLSMRSIFFYILPIYYLGVAIYSFIGTFIFDFATIDPLKLYRRLTDQNSVYEAIYILVFAVIAFTLGWFFASKFFVSNHTYSINKNFFFPRNLRRYLIVFNLIVIMLFLFGNGISSLIERPAYAVYNAPRIQSFLSLHLILFPFAIFGLAFIKQNSIRQLIFISQFIVLFASSSRLLGALFIIYTMASFFRSNFKLKFIHIIFLLIGIYFFIWAIAIRDITPHGFYPNMLHLFNQNVISEFGLLGFNYLTSFSVYALAFTIENPVDLSRALIASISPLPLSYYGGSEILGPDIYQFIGPSVIALINTFGYKSVFIFYLLFGFITYFISYKLDYSKLITLAILAIYFLAVLFSLQYNLRGFTRLMYLCIGLSIVARIRFRNFRFISLR